MTAGDVATVMLVEDDADLRASLAQMLTLAGYDVRAFDSGPAALDAIHADLPGVVVTDVRMPQMSGIELLHMVRGRDPDLPVLLMTGHGDVAMAVDALKAGAWDFLTKPFDPDALSAAIGRAIAQRAAVLDNRRLRALIDAPDTSPLLGRSLAIERLREMVAMLCGAEIDVLIEGETGTGKELVARLIHQGRPRRGRFVTVACAMVPDALLDTDLFSGTGGVVAAHGGTLLLDDVDRASPALQARLAALCADRAIRLPGRRAAIPVECRIIATSSEGATSIEPALLYRLAAVRLRVPPLRERREDLPLLFAHLLDDAAARMRRPVPDLTPDLRGRLAGQDWPGNVRELAHFADRVVLGLEVPDAPAAAARQALPDRVAAFERQEIIDAVMACGGDIGDAITRLGLPRKTFYYKVQRHGVDLKALRRASR